MSRLPQSFTKLNDFDNCPLQYAHKYVYKDAPKQGDSPHLIKGREVHASLERGLKGEPLEENLQHMQTMVDKLSAAFDWVVPEMRVALDGTLRETEYFGKDVWWRIGYDVVGMKGKTVSVIDWKTGKVSEDKGQLALYAATAMCKWPHLEKVQVAYVWVEHKKTLRKEYPITRFEHLWRHFGSKATEIDTANERNDWPAKPSGLCRFCPVTGAQCQHKRQWENR
jgi:hypothetical protein